MGDEADGVPGIQHLAPGFGRKTAVKLLNKHGSLENLLKTAAVRTVGKEYAQDVLVKHADYLRKNYEVLSLKRYQFLQMYKTCKISICSCPYLGNICLISPL